MTKYDWSKVPDGINWIAIDEVCGEHIAWGYKRKPIKINDIWSGSEPYLIGVGIFIGNWQDSLEERPK